MAKNKKNPAGLELIQPKFSIGQEIHVVFWDGDIDAYNVEEFVCDWIRVTYKANSGQIEYGHGDIDCGYDELNDLFETSYDAAQEAKTRNQAMRGE